MGLEYEDRTDGIPTTMYAGVRAEDSKVFYETGSCYDTISFGRSPFKGYHRGGRDTNVGDVMIILDNDLFKVESEVVASVALHCTVDSEHRFENVSLTPYDSDGDGNNDSVHATFNITTDTNTPLMGRVGGRLYYSNNIPIPGSRRLSDLYMLEKNKTENGYLNFRLPFGCACGDYTVRLKVRDYWGDVDDEYNGTVYLHPYSKPITGCV